MAALAGLSAAGSAASIGSFFFDAWNAKSKKKFMELDHLLEETGDNLQKASDTISQNADILEPGVKYQVLKGVKVSSLKHEKNIGLQTLAHKGKLSRAERKDYAGAVRENVQTANNVYLRAQHSSNVARTKLLLETEGIESTNNPVSSVPREVPQAVTDAPPSTVPAGLQPSIDVMSDAVTPSIEAHELLPSNEDPFVDPTLPDQGLEVGSLGIELRRMTI